MDVVELVVVGAGVVVVELVVEVGPPVVVVEVGPAVVVVVGHWQFCVVVVLLVELVVVGAGVVVVVDPSVVVVENPHVLLSRFHLFAAASQIHLQRPSHPDTSGFGVVVVPTPPVVVVVLVAGFPVVVVVVVGSGFSASHRPPTFSRVTLKYTLSGTTFS